jgi:hypothetical protein
MTRRRKGKEHTSRYMALEYWLMKSCAWREASCVARCAYIEIKMRYAGPGSNNGRIPYSLLEMAKALNVSKATAGRALKELQDKGFIVLMKRGAFSVKNRMASEWRLTELTCDVTRNLSSREFTRWPEKQNTVSPVKPNGCRDETERVST